MQAASGLQVMTRNKGASFGLPLPSLRLGFMTLHLPWNPEISLPADPLWSSFWLLPQCLNLSSDTLPSKKQMYVNLAKPEEVGKRRNGTHKSHCAENYSAGHRAGPPPCWVVNELPWVGQCIKVYLFFIFLIKFFLPFIKTHHPLLYPPHEIQSLK